jgi:hypothetical protein
LAKPSDESFAERTESAVINQQILQQQDDNNQWRME